MILSFARRETETLFNRIRSRRFGAIERQARRKLLMLDAAQALDDLRHPPGNRLEALRGDRAGQHSIRINDQWRVCFVWTSAGPHDVEIVDYHQPFTGHRAPRGSLLGLEEPQVVWPRRALRDMAKKYDPIHPGEVLKEEFLGPLGVNAAEFARVIRVPPNRVTRLINGQSTVTPDTALRLARALRTTPEFWLNLQLRYEQDSVADAGGPFDEISPIVEA